MLTIIACIVGYILGFIFTFWFFAGLNGLISPGLIWARAIFWPIFWTTGWPSGQRQRMD